MTEHTYRDTTWRAELMGSEGWAVFAGPRMLASCLWAHQARFIVTACNSYAELLEALKNANCILEQVVDSFPDNESPHPSIQECMDALVATSEAIRNTEEQAK